MPLAVALASAGGSIYFLLTGADGAAGFGIGVTIGMLASLNWRSHERTRGSDDGGTTKA